jgi:purine-binding chemotaxis protein CheW
MSQIIPLFKRIQNPEKEKTIGGRLEKFFEFSFGNKKFVIPAVDITEIVIPATLVKIDSEPFVEGVVNVRGTVIPVINLRKRINLEEEYNISPQTRLVVLTMKQKNHLGFMVDSIENRLKDGVTENSLDKKLDGEKVFTYAIIDNQKYPILLIDTWLEIDEFKLLEKISSENI